MLKNYLTTAWRAVLRHKGYAALNVAGLAVGLACCLLILQYVQDERRYDQHHEHAADLYRVVASNSGDGQPTNANGGFAWAQALEADFPEVLHAVRFDKLGWGEKRVVARGSQRFYEDGLYFADPSVFDVFTLPLVAGDPATALTAPNTLVLTEAMAEKYFPGDNALGQILQADPFNDGTFLDFTITGVLENLPTTTHFHFDFLASWATKGAEPNWGWGWNSVFTYVRLRPGTDPATVQARMDAWQQGYMGEDPWYSMHLQPVTDIRLHSQLRAELEPNGNIAYVYLFGAIAVFVLVLACINFMNLTTARAARRSREVGVRKALGAGRGQLIAQFLGEALLLSGLALTLAWALFFALLPVFNSIAGKTIVFSLAESGGLLAGSIGLALLVGVLAGSYPALFLSGFRPVLALKGSTGGRGSTAALLRRGLVVFQFAIAIGLMVCTALVAQQMDYIRGKNLGFDREQVVVLPLNDEIRSQYEAFKNAWVDHPHVLATTVTEQVPGRAGNGVGVALPGNEDFNGVYRAFIDPDYVETYGLEIVAGRDLSTDIPSDATTGHYLVNESFVRVAGWASPEAALGQPLTMRHASDEFPGQIVGVLKDFHLFSLHEAADDEFLFSVMPMHKLNFVSVRLAPGAFAPALAHLQETWQTFAPSYPFEYYFIDDDFARLHQADARLGQVFTAFAALALLVACLGLFGLASFTAEQRTKEIGVRKVLGATVPSLLLLLTKSFTRWVLLAFVLAAPVAWFAMQTWLATFAYRATPSLWPFLLVGFAALVLAWATVGYQALRTATADPVRALRYE